NKQNIGRIDGRKFLVRMLAAALWRNVGYGAFQDLEQSLLHTFARNITRDRRILVLAPDLIDLIDVDNALLTALHVPIGILQQPQNDVLHVFADVASFRQSSGVYNREGNVQDPR